MDDKLVVIHQPDFMPYAGFFDRLHQADIYVVLDNVQYVRGCKDQWTNRDRIKTRNGASWITVNVKKRPLGTLISEVELTEEHDWRSKCKNAVWNNYKDAPFFNQVFPDIERMFDYPCVRLMDFNLNAIKKLNDMLGIEVEMICASDLKPEGHSNEVLVSIMKKLGQKRYLSGTGARDYFDENVYRENSIDVIWQEFEHPVYRQQFGEFIPYLSIIDMLLNCGIEQTRQIIRGER